MAVDLSYLDEQVQKWVYEYFKENGFLKPVQVEALKNYPNLSNVTQFSVICRADVPDNDCRMDVRHQRRSRNAPTAGSCLCGFYHPSHCGMADY